MSLPGLYEGSDEVAVISDIHGNLPALLVALKEIERRGIKRIICLGDIVGYGPYPSECLSLVRARAELIIRGNHDDASGRDDAMPYFNQVAQAAMAWTRRELANDQRKYLAALPLKARWEGMFLTHANFINPEYWGYIMNKSQASLNLEKLTVKVGLFGHTHRPVIFRRSPDGVCSDNLWGSFLADDKCLINPGSIGQPRDGDPRLSFLLITPSSGKADLVRLDYPIEETIKQLRVVGLPSSLGDRLIKGS